MFIKSGACRVIWEAKERVSRDELGLIFKFCRLIMVHGKRYIGAQAYTQQCVKRAQAIKYRGHSHAGCKVSADACDSSYSICGWERYWPLAGWHN